MSVTQRMRVVKYVPSRLYGFAVAVDGRQVFFHLGEFQPGKAGDTARCNRCDECLWATVAPPPVLGEEVDVTFTPNDSERAPAAERVVRLTPPLSLQGKVEHFDPQRGYGFIAGSDGQSHYLHASEVRNGKTPVVGGIVRFFVGTRQDKPRACHVRICR